MIDNDTHYRVAKARAREFQRALAELDARVHLDRDIDPELLKLERDGLYYPLLELTEQIRAYEASQAAKPVPNGSDV